MDDLRNALRALVQAQRMLLEEVERDIDKDKARIISGLLRDAGEAIGDQTLASDATSLETDPTGQ